MSSKLLKVFLPCLLGLAPLPVFAHGFAQRYDLPVPLGHYLVGAGATVAFSFLVIALFVRRQHTVREYPRFNFLDTRIIGNVFGNRFLLHALRLAAIAMLVLVVYAGLFGNPDPFQNLAPTTVWVIWWVGLAYFSGLVGDLWALINPWKAVHQYIERLVRAVRPGFTLDLGYAYPRWLGYWPAVVLLLAFVWAELVWQNSDDPFYLGYAVLGYSLITWTGMIVFGRHIWLRHGECFSIVFNLLARFAPTEIRTMNRSLCAQCQSPQCKTPGTDCVNCVECFERAAIDKRQFNARPPTIGLLVETPVPPTMTVFVLIILSSVTFDGLLATPLWADTAKLMLYSETIRPLIIALQDVTGNAIAAITTLALILFLTIFQVLYLLFCALMRLAIPAPYRQKLSVAEIAGLFVFTLIPISLAYHLAHYLSFLLIVGQYMIPLASDPFGWNWNLFGTALYMVDISIVNARFIWTTSVVTIVLGHVAAVYLAHVVALRALKDNRAALLSQIPMLLLMVAYTMLSLWILAQPVVETS